MKTWISVEHLYKCYYNPEGEKHFVLNGLSLQLFYDELLVILGRSGTGKSVLLRHIVGLEQPDSGTIRYSEELLDKGQLKNWEISMVFQGGALFNFLSVRENIAFGLRAYNEQARCYSSEDIDDRVTQFLYDLGLERVANFMPDKLSGGMIKRVALARSLIYSPKVVLYDEPTAGLDPMASRGITDLIARMRKKHGVAGIIITHDIPLALALGDRIAVHADGVLKKIYTKEEFLHAKDGLADQFLTSCFYSEGSQFEKE